jgi:peptidoglycan/xylan/chitin deacetylase (PgdA/CDA1 family)
MNGASMMARYVKKYGLLTVGVILVIFGWMATVPIQATLTVKDISVFCYHRVINNPRSQYDLTPGQLEAHFQYFKNNGYQPITMAQFLKYQKKPALFPAKPVVLTFDDGTQSHYDSVLPLLKKYGFKATFYIFPNATRGNKRRWLDWEEIAALAQAGMDIGSHTLSHPYLTARGKMDEAQYQAWLEKEVTQSKKMLEDHLKIQVKTLAYPFGLYDRQVEAAAIKAGYAGMLNINPGPNRYRANPYRLKRRIVVNTMGPKSLANILGGRALELKIQSPSDGEVLAVLPAIRFRVKTPGVSSVRLGLSKYQTVLTPDADGICSYIIPGRMKRGFYTIIVRGKDAANQSCLNSWSFWYRLDGSAK